MATRKRRQAPPVLGFGKPPFLKKRQFNEIKVWMRDNEPFSWEGFTQIPGFDIQTLYETWMYMAEKPMIYPIDPDNWVRLRGGRKYNLLKHSEDLTEYMKKGKSILNGASANEACDIVGREFIARHLSYTRARKLLRYLDKVIPELNVLRDLIEEEIEKPKDTSEAICSLDQTPAKGTLATLTR